MHAILLTLLCLLDPQPENLEVSVDQTPRHALVFAPEGNTSPQSETPAAPVVLVFHGHGGTSNHAARTMAFQEHWPEAIVVYPQGLATVTGRDPEGKKPGWQNNTGLNDDRDLKFFDALLVKLRDQYRVDETRIYATGHSNGGGFTYLLWGTRSNVLAAVAPCAARGGRHLSREGVEPLPVLHIAGRNDPVVDFAAQVKTIDLARQFNRCVGEGSKRGADLWVYDSPQHAPVATFIHEGDHKYPAKAPALIVQFFKEHSRAKPDATTPAQPASDEK